MTSARATIFCPFTVISEGSPGPAPMRYVILSKPLNYSKSPPTVVQDTVMRYLILSECSFISLHCGARTLRAASRLSRRLSRASTRVSTRHA